MHEEWKVHATTTMVVQNDLQQKGYNPSDVEDTEDAELELALVGVQTTQSAKGQLFCVINQETL